MGFAAVRRLLWLFASVAVLQGVLVSGFGFSTSTPSQCQDFTVTWNGGQAPYHLVLVPVEEVEGGHISNISIPTSASGSYTYKLDQPAGLKFLATMYDSRGWGTGGTTGVLTVGSSSDSSCVPSSSSLQYDFMFSINPQNNPGQCSSMAISWDSKAQAPVGLYGIIPGGSAFEISIPQGSPYSTNWDVNIAQGTQFLLLMSDNGPHQTGGSTNLLTVGGGSGSCLNGNSPKTGGNSGSSSLSSAASSSSASATSSASSAASSASGSASQSATSSASQSASSSASSGSGSASATGTASSARASASAGTGSAGIAGQGGSSSGGSDGSNGGSAGDNSGSSGGGSTSSNLGAIIGGVVGGVVVLALLGLLLFCCLRRKRRANRRDSATDHVSRDYGVTPAAAAAMSEKPRRGQGGRGRNRYSMAGVAAAATGRRNDTDDETGDGTTDDESAVGHPVEMADPQYRASPFTGSQSHGPANASGPHAGSPYSPVAAGEDSWGTGVLAAAGFDSSSEKARYSQSYSPRNSHQYPQYDTQAAPYLPPGAGHWPGTPTGAAASTVVRGNSIRKQPASVSAGSPMSPTTNTTSVGDTRFVQHEDAGVVDLPPRYDQLRARNPDP